LCAGIIPPSKFCVPMQEFRYRPNYSSLHLRHSGASPRTRTSAPASGQPRPHAVTSISGGTINTTFTYDAKGNMTAGNGLTVSHASYNKPTSITRGTTSIGFSHDSEHQRFQQTAPGRTTLYLGGAEKFTGSGGAVVERLSYDAWGKRRNADGTDDPGAAGSFVGPWLLVRLGTTSWLTEVARNYERRAAHQENCSIS
jgi:hypothetical protein